MAYRILISLAGVLLVAGCTKVEPAADPVRAVRTQAVELGSVSGVFDYAAEVRPRIESRLGFRVGGKITRRLVQLGDTVKRGQVLAELDPQDLRLAQDSARASLAAAQANLDLASADFKRYADLKAQGFVGGAELERRDAALKAAKAQLDQARAQSNVQGNQAGYARLTSDADGVITGVDAEPGMVVAAGASVVRLAREGPRDVVFSVPEDKVDQIKLLAALPDSFKVRLWGTPDELPASIREISAAADPMTRTFQVKADIGAEASAKVRLGQTATVLMQLPKTSGIAKLPLSALKEEGGKTVVWLVDRASMTVKQQPIQLAGADGNDAVVTGGLSPGQLVVTAGVHVLTPGQKVKLYVDPGASDAPDSAPATAVSIK